jgi:hypothetical protein
MGLYVRNQGSGSGFDHDDRFSSFSTPAEREVAELKYALAASQEHLKALQAIAGNQQSAEVAKGLDAFGHDQANDYNVGGSQRRRQTIGATGQGSSIPDPSWGPDIPFQYDDGGRPRQNQGKAATGMFPSRAHFTKGDSVPVRRYKRPYHLQREFEDFAADIGTPILRYSDRELADLGLRKAPIPASRTDGLIF